MNTSMISSDMNTVLEKIEHLTNFFGTPIDRHFISCLESRLIENKVSKRIVDELALILLDRC